MLTPAEQLADEILRAAGSSLSRYSLHSVRAGIVAAAQSGIDRARADLLHCATEAAHPDFLECAMDNVHDMDVTLRDYADAASRAILAALKGENDAR